MNLKMIFNARRKIMKNEYTVNKKEIISWSIGYRFRSAVGILLICLYSVALLTSVALFSLLLLFGGDALEWAIAFVTAFLSIYKLFFSQYVFACSKYRILADTYGVAEWIRSVELTDEDITMVDHTSVNKLRYDNLKRIIDGDRIVILMFNNNITLRIYKDKFTQGTWQECKEMLEAKMK